MPWRRERGSFSLGSDKQLCHSVKVVSVLPLQRELLILAKLPENDRPTLWAAISIRATHLLNGDFKAFGRLYGQTINGVSIMPPAVYLKGHRGYSPRMVDFSQLHSLTTRENSADCLHRQEEPSWFVWKSYELKMPVEAGGFLVNCINYNGCSCNLRRLLQCPLERIDE